MRDRYIEIDRIKWEKLIFIQQEFWKKKENDKEKTKIRKEMKTFFIRKYEIYA